MATLLHAHRKPPRPSPASERPASAARGQLALIPALAVITLVLLPVATVVIVALSGNGEDWPHLAANVLPRATLTTLALLAMVALFSAAVGVAAAWFVNSYQFPLRRTLAWMLVLPIAIPPYLAAYAMGEFLHFTGPVQSLIREIGSFQSARDYWFPDIRSTPGAAFVLASVLYPYVYLTTRIVFLMQGRHIADVARTLGSSPLRVFMTIQLPVARPAIVAGLVLVLMETLNDIGAVEYLGVRSLTFAVYSTWLNRGSLEGAAQIACLMLLLVMSLVWLEQWARRRQRFHDARSTQMRRSVPRIVVGGYIGAMLSVLCAIPVIVGFAIPVGVLGGYAIRRLEQFSDPQLYSALGNSVIAASVTALLAIALALVLANAIRHNRSKRTMLFTRFAVIGYALPGTILGLGLLILLARVDNWLGSLIFSTFSLRSGLLFTGTAAAVIYACTVRFLAVADSAIQSGLHKLPPDIDPAARLLGHSSAQTARQILLPLLAPAIMTAGVIVFVDTVKELSATILLRPFGYNTLATLVYENASRGAVEDGAVAALMIVAAAVVPVMLLSRALINDRDV